MAYVETRADLEWELWMMDMCTGIGDPEYTKKRRSEIKIKLAEMILASSASTPERG